MRFPTLFKRQVGGASADPLLGSDADPNTLTPTISGLQQSNVHNSPFATMTGWPGHRLAIGYSGPMGALALPVSVFVFDEVVKRWFKVPQPAPVTLIKDEIRFLDILGLLNGVQSNTRSVSAGALEAYIKIDAAGADPDGVYTFIVGSDLTPLAV